MPSFKHNSRYLDRAKPSTGETTFPCHWLWGVNKTPRVWKTVGRRADPPHGPPQQPHPTSFTGIILPGDGLGGLGLCLYFLALSSPLRHGEGGSKALGKERQRLTSSLCLPAPHPPGTSEHCGGGERGGRQGAHCGKMNSAACRPHKGNHRTLSSCEQSYKGWLASDQPTPCRGNSRVYQQNDGECGPAKEISHPYNHALKKIRPNFQTTDWKRRL